MPVWIGIFFLERSNDKWLTMRMSRSWQRLFMFSTLLVMQTWRGDSFTIPTYLKLTTEFAENIFLAPVSGRCWAWHSSSPCLSCSCPVSRLCPVTVCLMRRPCLCQTITLGTIVSKLSVLLVDLPDFNLTLYDVLDDRTFGSRSPEGTLQSRTSKESGSSHFINFGYDTSAVSTPSGEELYQFWLWRKMERSYKQKKRTHWSFEEFFLL